MARIYMHLIMLLLYTRIETVNTTVSWTFKPDVIRIGETLYLVCTITDVDVIDDALIRQWTKGPELICYNGHPINRYKYKEVIKNGNQIELQINNVTDSDLRCKYQCRYSFETQTKGIHLSAFEYPPDNDTKASIHTNISDGSTAVQLHLKKVYPMPNCTIAGRESPVSFQIVKIHRHGMYYEVHMLYQFAKLTTCNEELEVTCQLIDQYRIPVTVNKVEMCKYIGDSRKDFTILIGVSSILVIVAIVIAFRMYILRDKQGKSNGYKVDDCSESCKVLITEKGILNGHSSCDSNSLENLEKKKAEKN